MMSSGPIAVTLALCSVFALAETDPPAPAMIASPGFELVPAEAVGGSPLRLRGRLDVLTVFESRGVKLIDVSRIFRADLVQTAQEDAVFNGASGMRLLQLPDLDAVLVSWRFENEESLLLNARLRPDGIRIGNELVMPVTCDPTQWQRIREALKEESRSHDALVSIGAEAAATLDTLATLRELIATYREEFGHDPEFDLFAWQQMIDAGILAAPPINLLSECSDRSRIVTLHEADKTGSYVPADQAGWVWNAATSTLFAAGFDDAELQASAREQERMLAELRHLQLDAAQNGSPWMKERATRQELAQMRTSIDRQYATYIEHGVAMYPTLRDVRGGSAMSHRIGPNPYNGSESIQQAEWNADNPPIFGGAGWNYDPNTGRFWPNSNFAGENRF